MKTNKIVVGILAHVDAGKTTLSESLLYLSGSIRKMGRVDHKDAFLDTFELERSRGITIFAKQAVFDLGDKEVTLLDTPGHVDFSAEMERTLQVLDYAILVINGADGVQGHTLTLWKLLKIYDIPVFLFVNKMDQSGTERDKLMQEIEQRLDERCIDFSSDIKDDFFYDKLAMCEERLMNRYLESDKIGKQDIMKATAGRKVFPVYFGSALKLEGVKEFMDGLLEYTLIREYPDEFGAKIFKIARDSQGNRLTYMKITGGILKVKDVLTNEKKNELTKPFIDDEIWKEKVDQIRIYSGTQFQAIKAADAGTICAVIGLSKTHSGEGMGTEITSKNPVLKPVLTYKIQLPNECDVHGMLMKLRELEEEEPHLNIVWDDKSNEIHAQVMGQIEIEILKSIILERFGVEVEFGTGSLVYKETIYKPVEGIGHFEPLRHYAEVHLLLEPGEPGSGLMFDVDLSEDKLDRNWQRLVLTHLKEKNHKGVLTGSEITDIKITLVAGRAHKKHTEGGDFRQATYRALRQGLKKAKCILLEPIYEYRLEIPRDLVGRAMADVSKMKGSFDEPILEGDFAILTGEAPVATMRDYQMEVINYTKGMGRMFVLLKGYEPCHNSNEIIETIGYDSETDSENPTGSVFCAHGTGFGVHWDQVEEYMHVESGLNIMNEPESDATDDEEISRSRANQGVDLDKELEGIFEQTYGPIKKDIKSVNTRNIDSVGENSTEDETFDARDRTIPEREVLEKYLLVDGYNIIFAWDDLIELAKDSLDAARMKLLDVMSNYKSYRNETVIVVFDAYRVAGNRGEMSTYHNIHVVYTKEAETADQYIERLVHKIGYKYDVTVATSDALEQMIIMGKGATRLSARGLQDEVDALSHEIRSNYLNREKRSINKPFHDLDEKRGN